MAAVHAFSGDVDGGYSEIIQLLTAFSFSALFATSNTFFVDVKRPCDGFYLYVSYCKAAVRYTTCRFLPCRRRTLRAGEVTGMHTI